MQTVLPVLKTVLTHMFSRKSLKYRAYTITWTMLACYFWTNKLIESLELTATIVIGKFLFYGIWDFWHIEFGEKIGWKLFFIDVLLIIAVLAIEVVILYGVINFFI